VALVLLSAAGCATSDGLTGADSPVETGAVAADSATFTLTVAADSGFVTVTGAGSMNTCIPHTTCHLSYAAGTSLTVDTPVIGETDCFFFSRWDGACAGQTHSCSLILNSDLSTTAVYQKRHCE
jgi:hypothetical protein